MLTESALVICAYCGEPIDLQIDLSVARQEYVEDCAVCCQPLLVCIAIAVDGELEVHVRQENG